MLEEKQIQVATIKKDFPSISDLYDVSNIELAFKKDQFNLLMNQPPDPKWILENKFTGNSKYIPIGIIETLLQRVFKEFKVEVLREGTMFNAVYVTVRLHYLHPITNEWGFYDGLGSCQIQTKQGASPADLQSINNNAVMMALPMAKSYAIKDASDHFGKLFGRDLNRKDTMGFGVDKSLDSENVFQELKNFFEIKKDLIPSIDFKDIENSVNSEFDIKKIKAYKRFIDYLKKL
jgi:hypothetical protein